MFFYLYIAIVIQILMYQRIDLRCVDTNLKGDLDALFNFNGNIFNVLNIFTFFIASL